MCGKEQFEEIYNLKNDQKGFEGKHMMDVSFEINSFFVGLWAFLNF